MMLFHHQFLYTRSRHYRFGTIRRGLIVSSSKTIQHSSFSADYEKRRRSIKTMTTATRQQQQQQPSSSSFILHSSQSTFLDNNNNKKTNSTSLFLLSTAKLQSMIHTTKFREFSTGTSSGSGSGAGIGNVHDQMLPPINSTQFNHMFQHTKNPKTVSIIGAPMTFGQPYVGTDYGPSLLREAGLNHHLTSIGWRINDLGDLNFDNLQKNYNDDNNDDNNDNDAMKHKNSQIVGRGCHMLATSIENELKQGHFPLILGGDHSIAVGSLAGILQHQPNIGVIWVDAHADINTPFISQSGNMHGMPIGLLLDTKKKKKKNDNDNDASRIPGFEWLSEYPRLNPSSIVYVGLRDVDIAERQVLKENNITTFTMHEVDRYGIGKVMDLALSHLLSHDSTRPIHVSYDIDAVDPIHAPATGTAVRGGLTYREAHYVAEAVARSGSLTSVEIVELNPTLSNEDGSKETVELGVGLVTSLMGKSIL